MASILKRSALALLVILVLLAALLAWTQYSNSSDLPSTATTGPDPKLVDPAPQWFPSVSLPKTVGWGADGKPDAGKGLSVSRFAEGLDHPRTMLTLPNGDVLVTETNAPAVSREGGGITGAVARWMMKRVGAGEASPDTIVLLRDANGDGKAEQRFTFRTADMRSPSGMAYGDGTLYVADHDAVLAFPFTPGATKLTSAPRKLMDLPAGGQHWMRNLLLSPDGAHLYVAVGSGTNVADNGLDAEKGRAGIWEIDTKTGSHRPYAAGMRNPNGMDWNPSTGMLWATVQERDMLGPDLVPDYLTDVPVGAQYGWPWVYWRDHFDDRANYPMQIGMTDYTRRPRYAMGAHTAVLGMTFAKGGERLGPGFANGAFIARHGSWNRRPAVGYDVVYVPFDALGNATAAMLVPVLSGFLDGKGDTHGRPVWLTWGHDGSLLVSDDTAGMIWRVIAPGAAPSPAPKPVVTDHMKPQTELKDPSLITPQMLMGGMMKSSDGQ
ncbi:PQQ-dependent sugar dehydrogenase [Novosphingobium sp. 9]|uniref:PQQ-dependent sugar dehydrogenase n=1 Tax=Novosphingobium sp. 9 TaxID=2025349 RepID=UPI0021B69502|nr:sorbosone dehydrogenase family protein [Novosphingobium sp. 9]